MSTQKPSSGEHIPVLVREVLELLVTDPGGAYIDLTAGRGGHLKALAATLSPTARLYGLDRDPRATEAVTDALAGIEQPSTVATASYRDVRTITSTFKDRKFSGMLLDLGLSSAQLDSPERGFSFRFEGPLDMRFDPQSTPETAADLIARADLDSLTDIFRRWGEERQARRIAHAIIERRNTAPIRTTTELVAVIASVVPERHRTKSLARIFQALRIAVNGELDALDAVLPDLPDLLETGGRLAVITYHSLEDRAVKNFIRDEAKGCICPPRQPVCTCGREPRLTSITRRPVVPTAAEIDANPRARSAKLRVAERV